MGIFNNSASLKAVSQIYQTERLTTNLKLTIINFRKKGTMDDIEERPSKIRKIEIKSDTASPPKHGQPSSPVACSAPPPQRCSGTGA